MKEFLLSQRDEYSVSILNKKNNMKFKGTIIITDPCYIINDYSEQGPTFVTWPGLEGLKSSTLFSDYSKAQRKAYNKLLKAKEKFRKEYDDWVKCNEGTNMEILGINHYMIKSTIYGDWSCNVYAIDDPKKAIEDIAKMHKWYSKHSTPNISEEERFQLITELHNMYDKINYKYYIGEFCADSGLVSVFLLDEVLSYNPNFLEWAEDHPWCVTLIKDFDGEIEYYIDTEGDAHIIGTGSINFFTTQINL